MDFLTAEQIDLIDKRIKRLGVSDENLQIDLVDHICCIIEDEMEKGEAFSTSIEFAIAKFGAAGLLKVQKETTYILGLNSLFIKVMTGLNYFMTFLLLLISLCFIFTPILLVYYQTTWFNGIISLPFIGTGILVLISGFDFKQFDVKSANSNIRDLKISLA